MENKAAIFIYWAPFSEINWQIVSTVFREVAWNLKFIYLSLITLQYVNGYSLFWYCLMMIYFMLTVAKIR